jgi:hypothetical protein
MQASGAVPMHAAVFSMNAVKSVAAHALVSTGVSLGQLQVLFDAIDSMLFVVHSPALGVPHTASYPHFDGSYGHSSPEPRFEETPSMRFGGSAPHSEPEDATGFASPDEVVGVPLTATSRPTFRKRLRKSKWSQGDLVLLCRRFAKHRCCKFGDECKFSHGTPDNAATYVDTFWPRELSHEEDEVSTISNDGPEGEATKPISPIEAIAKGSNHNDESMQRVDILLEEFSLPARSDDTRLAVVEVATDVEEAILEETTTSIQLPNADNSAVTEHV